MKYLLFLLFLLWGNITTTLAQGLTFVPPVHNYQQTQYKAGMQNWGLAQDSKGVLYVANNQGLLSYDGRAWQLHYLPKKKIARSVFVTSVQGEERIYVGSFEEFGYFKRNAQQHLVYTSLKSQVQDYSFHNDEVWHIFSHHNHIYFQTFSSYFVFDGKQVRAFTSLPAPFAMFSVENTLYLQGVNAGFYTVSAEQQLSEVLSAEQLGGSLVIAVIPHQQQLLLVTNKNGLFLYEPQNKTLRPFVTDIDDTLRTIRLNRAIKTTKGNFVLGSLNDGIFCLQGSTGKKIWHINKHNALSNNTVLGLYEDAQHNLWATLDNGIAYIETQSPLRFLNLNSDIGLVSDMAQLSAKFYLASNKGIYTLEGQNLNKLPNFSNQVWFVKQFDGQLFVGHNKGVSELIEDKLVPLNKVGVGGMDLKKGFIHGQEVLVGSSYTYLTIYKKNEAGKWAPAHMVEGFFDLIYRIEIDPMGNIWANHTHKGVYKLSLTEDLKHIKQKTVYDHLNTKGTLKLLKIRGKVVFTDGTQFYSYNEDKEQITPYPLLSTQLKALVKAQSVVPINDNQFWCITDTDYYVVTYANGKYTITEKIPFEQLLYPASEERAIVYVSPEGTSYFCLDGSIALYKTSTSHLIHTDNLCLKSLQTYERHTDTYVSEKVIATPSFPYAKNNIVFYFQYPNFSKEHYRLQYVLQGYDKRWNEAGADFSVSYQNLPSGKYVLRAKIVNELGKELSVRTFPFQIIAPWYRNVWMYVLYFLLLIGSGILVSSFYFRYKMKKKERAHLREKLRKERLLQAQEQEITKLQNQVLATQLEHKSKALAEATMMNIKHDDFLANLMVELEKLMQEQKLPKTKSHIILQHIRENISKEDQWLIFQENFDMIHKNFFKNLKERYPDLTPTDLRLAVLIRLNYNTKEIATMQGVSIRGVETARYRLRKKLQLNEDDNLYNFFVKFE